MLVTQFTAAALSAKNTHAIDEIARLTWRAHAEGHLPDAEAEAVSEALQARRRAFSAGQGLPAPKVVFAAPRPVKAPRSPDRRRSIERRRRQAASGVVPSKLASGFTQAENAVLTIIGRQIQRHGTCSLHVDAIAALAGCCRTSVQNALRAARAGGLLLVKERRIPGRRSLTNILTIISPVWKAWLRLGNIGFKNLSTPINPTKKTQSAPSATPTLAASGGKKDALRAERGSSRGASASFGPAGST